MILAPGVTATQIVVRVNGDTQPEADETFHFLLSNATNVPIAKAVAGTPHTCMQSRLGTRVVVKDGADAWAPLRNVAGVGGTVAINDTNATTRTRFYRAWAQ